MRPARIFLSILLLITSLIAFMPAAAAPLAQDRLAIITSPRDGAQLRGVVQISGTATDPKFDHYELTWAAQSAADNWQVIAVVQNQIVNGSLGTWDTTQLQPGVYLLRLRVVRNEDKSIETVVRDLSVNQETPTPTPVPTEPIGPTIPPLPTQGVVAVTPTVLIVQPPTSTPQVTAAAKPGSVAVSTPSSSARTPTVQVNLAGFGSAFCNGVLYTFLIFMIWGIVWGGRQIARWVLRQMRTQTPPKS